MLENRRPVNSGSGNIDLPPGKLVDPTGCGDTYMAGYLFLRQKTDDLQKVGEFAARTASSKLASYGPFKANQEHLKTLPPLQHSD